VEKQNRHRIFALLFALVVLFPSTIQVIHALENHEHVVCTAKDIKHIHEQNDDCSIYHTIIDNNFILLHHYNDEIAIKTYFERFNTTTQINSLGFLKLKSSRGPPIFS